MYDIVTSLVINLNQVEVHGERNLALLYNCIDTLKQLQAAYRQTTGNHQNRGGI